MISVGKAALYLSAVISVVLLFVMPYVAKDRRKADAVRACYWWLIGVFGALSVAIGVLLTAFIAKDYGFQYAASYSSADMALPYRIAALWAGSEGSMLLWAWMLAGFTAAIAALRLKNPNKLDTYALIILNDVQIFFVTLLIVVMDPFVASPAGTTVGQGINPLLMHWAMIFHPPTLFVGYAGLTVPFAYAMAAAWTRDPSAQWVKLCQRWSIFTWLFLSIGIFLGALWAYVVLGWGGYWGWDPVENASFLPWLTTTALLHSFTVYRRRDSFKLWSLSLAVVSFLLVIMATFITRGGIIQSVHAFEANNVLVWLFSGFILIVAAASGQLIAARYSLFRGHDEMASLASKEFMYFMNNLIMLLAAIILLAATMLPTFGGATLKADSYNTIAQPIGLVYMMILGVCPMLAWRKTDPKKFQAYALYPGIVTVLAAVPLFLYWQSLVKMVQGINPAAPANPLGYVGLLLAVFTFAGAVTLFAHGASSKAKRTNRSWLAAFGSLFVENRAQAGGYIAHMGVAIIVAGLVGSSMFVGDINQSIPNKPGATLDVTNYQLRLQKVTEGKTPKGEKTQTANFDLIDTASGKVLAVMTPGSVEHKEDEQGKMEARDVDVHYEPFRDVFVIFGGDNGDGTISVNVKINPLIMFVWGGSIILVLGMLIAFLPRRKGAAKAKSKAKAA